MPLETVKVRIEKKTGIVKMEMDGFVGEGCRVIEQIENAIGTVTERKDNDGAYQYLQPDFIPNSIQG